MSARSIKLNDIIKRSSCINSVTESKDTDRLYNILESSIDRNINIGNNLRSYIESMCNSTNATDHYYEPLELIETFNKKNPAISSYIMKEYTTRIIPYIKDLDSVSESVMRHDKLTNDQMNQINEAVSINRAADRILNNHVTFSKRFNIENEVKRYNTIGLKYVVDSCYDLIDTYKIKNYQKFNIVIEEVSYCLEKNGYKYNRADVARYCLEHFLSSTPYISSTDKENFTRTIRESYIIESKDQDRLCAIINMDQMPENVSIRNTVDYYLASPEKSIDNLSQLVRNLLVATSKDDIVNNIDGLVFLIWDLCKNKTFENTDNSELYTCMNIVSDYINSCTQITDNADAGDKDFTKEEVEVLIGNLIKAANHIREAGNCNSQYSVDAANFIEKAIDPLIAELKEVNHLLYPKSNLEAIDFVNSDNGESIPLNEFKLFKFHNLIRGAFNLEKFLKVKERKVYNNIRSKYQNFIKKGKNILFGESASLEDNMYSYIGEDCKADICIRQYSFDEDCTEDMSNFLSETCKEYNDVLDSQNLDTMRAYYIINPGFAEVRIKESTLIDIDEQTMEEVRTHIDPAFMTYTDIIKEANKLCDTYEGMSANQITDQLLDISCCENFTMEHFDLALECLSYLNIDRDTIKLFGERVSNYNFNEALNAGAINESYLKLASEERYISESIDNLKFKVEVPVEIQLEACQLLLDLLEEAGKPLVGGKAIEARNKSNDDDEEDDDWDSDDYDDNEEENPKKKTKHQKENPIDTTKDLQPYSNGKNGKIASSINNIRLGIKGLGTKMKDMSTKEKEISRNMDNAATVFMKSAKDALTNNRREAIIKGSLIPSFSRCIKAGILFAGVSVISLPLAIIGAMGAIGVSKQLNKKERLLLLDEIETELEVVEKELSIAESNNEMKKYRALLQYKKNLQRQYQRIRYNIRVGKDLPHASSDGMRGSRF